MADKINFVKFLRGTETAYQNLLEAQRTDENTLYFIYDKNSTEDNPKGKLYLDKFLIGGNTESNNLSLSDLIDTDIGTLRGEEILIFDNSSQTWKPVLLSDVIDTAGVTNINIESGIVKQPEEDEIDAIKRTFNQTSKPGDIGILSDGTVYLSESNNNWLKLIDGTVRDADIPRITSDISSLQSSLDNVYTKNETESKINELIAGKNHLSYEIKPNKEAIELTNPDNQNKVFLISRATADGEDNNYDEFMIINGSLEKIGDWKADLTNYIQAGDSRLLTDEQKTKLEKLVIDEDGQIAVSGTINANNVQGLQDFIDQHQFIKSVDTNVFNVTNAGKLELKNDYVTTAIFNSTVGNLADLGANRVSENSSLVEEINKIKESIIWEEMT